jgi:hypothetical protein
VLRQVAPRGANQPRQRGRDAAERDVWFRAAGVGGRTPPMPHAGEAFVGSRSRECLCEIASVPIEPDPRRRRLLVSPQKEQSHDGRSTRSLQAPGASRQPGQGRSSQRDRPCEQGSGTTADDRLRSLDQAEQDCPPLVAATGRDERRRPRVILAALSLLGFGTERCAQQPLPRSYFSYFVGASARPALLTRAVTSSRGLPIVAASQQGENRSTGAQNPRPLSFVMSHEYTSFGSSASSSGR